MDVLVHGPAALERELYQLFRGVAVVARVARPTMYFEPLLPQEAAGMGAAVPRRKQEFAAGRACARAALIDLIGAAVPIPRREDRTPVWPPTVVGSISHCDGFCAAIVAHESEVFSLGFDAERISALPPDLASMVCRADEISALACPQISTSVDAGKLTFSAKEAVYK